MSTNFASDVGVGTTIPLTKGQIHATGADIASGNAIKSSTMKGLSITNSLNDDSSVGVWFGTSSTHWAGISAQRSNSAADWGTELSFYTHEAGTSDVTYARERMCINSEGHVTPSADDTQDLGSSSKQWRNIYTGDLHLKNERGSWTVIEEENYLTLRNNKTDKVYKLVMEEIE